MKYYPHHIRDFNNATRHLTRLERSIYRDMIELYYETEEQLTLDFELLCRKVMARSNEERTAVEQALNEFFTETPTGYFHSVCDEVISEYRDSQSQKSAAGKASAAKRAARKQQAINGNPTTVATTDTTSVERTSNGTATNQEPITNNQITTPLAPQGGISGKRSSKPKAPKIGIDEFIAQCREAGEKPIQPDDPIFGYLQRIGLPEEYGALAWEWFKRRYASNMQAGVRGWRQTFRNAVEGNWPRYWFQADDGTWQLTTAGKQAQADYEAMQRQERAA